MGARPLRRLHHEITESYPAFMNLDGQHPWMKVVPEGFVPYRVRELGVGEITYFNFVLAKEMGLIHADHPHTLTSNLKETLLRTFSLQIINEYDELSKKKIDPSTIKPHKYMASRYLQLQHPNKKGKTSGDGRGIWNGTINHRGKIWDVSSRGTGVTRLAPGAVEANKPLKTGGTQFGYGCGQAETDELYGAAIMAEIMHLQGIATERVLCVIDLGRGFGIGVRAAPNLLRPAHLFMYLKQDRWEDLKKATDYLIQRQIQNNEWKIRSRSPMCYDDMCEEICKSFADFTARLDIDYIFAWLDWDGDNVLTNAGIIDYGSVRQFGIRHDRYRYDDFERFSTNLNEQRLKAKLIVQVFVQMVDYIKTKKKKPLKDFAKHPVVQKFNTLFSASRANRLLYRMGFNEQQRGLILKEKGLFEAFDREFCYFERSKVSGALQKVADGINHPPLFNMRSILRELPAFLLTRQPNDHLMSDEVFFKTILSVFAKARDTRIRPKHRGHIQNFQRLYLKMVEAAAAKRKPSQILEGINQRSRQLNREDRITGNALIQIVEEILTATRKGLPMSEIQLIIDQLILAHMGLPEINVSRYFDRRPRAVVRIDLISRLMNLVERHCQDI